MFAASNRKNDTIFYVKKVNALDDGAHQDLPLASSFKYVYSSTAFPSTYAILYTKYMILYTAWLFSLYILHYVSYFAVVDQLHECFFFFGFC